MSENDTINEYTVKEAGFSGPLELLLDLVESRKLFINEISLSKVTDEYLSYAKNLKGDSLSLVTSFVSIASTLILIKSRSLLPGFIVTEEEEKDIQNLEHRLELYSVIREVSNELSLNYGKTRIYFGKDRRISEPVFTPDKNLSLDLINMSVISVLNNVPKEEFLPEVRVRKIINIDEMITNLTERIAGAVKLSFNQWKSSLPGEDKESVKGNVIVSFLAMLELVRQGFMDAIQNEAFLDIELSKTLEQEVVHE